MFRCIQLAGNGLGTTYPNPLVGSVIVLNDIIIGEGWHYASGMPHAEVIAIRNVKDPDLLKKATLYVSLEPCSHFGKTPPCTNAILESGIRKIVVGSTDPNPKVSGKGIQQLRDSGCEVITGVLEEECKILNKRFFTFHQRNRPYIFLKWAQTTQGFIAPEETARKEQAPVWITGKRSRQLVHKMRAEEAAILIGTTTALLDNPSLTTRDWHGNSPVRVVLDRSLKISENASVLDERTKTIIITEKKSENSATNFYETIDFSEETMPKQVCSLLYKHQIQSVIVEGGSRTLQSFIDAKLWDEAYVFTGNASFKKGVNAPVIKEEPISEKKIANDILKIYKNN